MSGKSLYGVYVLILLLLAYVLSFVDRQLLNLFVGPVKADLGLGDFQFSLISGWAFALFYTLMGVPIGYLADTGNRRNIIAAGIALWSLMTACCGLAKNFITLFLARVGVAVGEAALSPAAYSMISDSFSPRQLPRAMAVFTLGITLGSGMAYLIGGAVVSLVQSIETVQVPLLGQLKPWQLAFVIVGLSGIPMALLLLATLLEPTRRETVNSGSAEAENISIVGVFHILWQRRRDYAVVIYVIPLLSVVGYAFLGWYPELLIRNYDMARSNAGYTAGWLYLIAGSIGTLGGAQLAGYLAQRGFADANARVIVIVATAIPLPAVLTPLAPSTSLSIALAAVTILLLNAYFGVGLAALQLITFNRIRARVSALLLLANNLLGLGFGTSLVAALTEFGFADESALGHSIALVALLFSIPAAILAWYALPGYRRALSARQP